MKPIVYKGTNHASLETAKISVYYGPNEIDPDTSDWCCVVWKKGIGTHKEVARYTNEQLLDIASGEGPLDMLMAGVALYLSK